MDQISLSKNVCMFKDFCHLKKENGKSVIYQNTTMLPVYLSLLEFNAFSLRFTLTNLFLIDFLQGITTVYQFLIFFLHFK